MNRAIRRIAAFLLSFFIAAQIMTNVGIQQVEASGTQESEFIRGVDVSTLDMLEDLGATYYVNGQQKDALTILHDSGANYVRLKLWVDPYDENGNPYGGGNNDYATTLRLAKRANALGMKILLDFHYSDFWADPANQIKPKSWSNLSESGLVKQIYFYTRDTLNDFASEGIYPAMVQVGNEISSGILHDNGKVGDGQTFDQLANLLGYAIAGVRASSDRNAKVILHLDQGGKNELYKWYFDSLLAVNPNLDFDVIGLSYYPMWHGTMEGLEYNLNYLAKTYDKEVCVVETAYAWTTEDGDGVGNVFIAGDEEVGGYDPTVAGQKEFMNDLKAILYNVPDNKGIGFFYWEPEWIPVEGGTYATSAGVAYKNDTVEPSNTWDNMTLFDFNGNALDSINVLNESGANVISDTGFETDSGYWSTWVENGDSSTVKREWGNAFDGDYKLTMYSDSAYRASVYKVITGLPNGTYQLTVEAMSGGGQNTLQLYAKNYGSSEVNAPIEKSDIGFNTFTLQNIKVTNGQCEIGIYTDANAGDWCNIDCVSFRKME